MKKRLLVHEHPVVTTRVIIRKKTKRPQQEITPKKQLNPFPIVQMPEQPECFLRANNYDCY